MAHPMYVHICLDSFIGLDILRAQMCHGKMDRMGDKHAKKNAHTYNGNTNTAIMYGLNKSPYCIMHNIYTVLSTNSVNMLAKLCGSLA